MAATQTPSADQPSGGRPSFDCAKAQSTAEKLVCSDRQLARLDVETARLFALAMDDSGLPAAKTRELKAMQRGWIKGRDDCWKNDDQKQCVADAYVTRIQELRLASPLVTRDATDAPSRPPMISRCPGIAEAISTQFVSVDPPMVALRWADRVLVLTAGPSGSGTRYVRTDPEGEYVFWNKGDEAFFQRPGAQEVTCTVRRGPT